MAGLEGLGKDDLKNVIQIRNAIRDVKSNIAATNKLLKEQGDQQVFIGDEIKKINKATSEFADLQDEAAASSSATTKALGKQAQQQSIVRTLNIQINELMAKSLVVSEKEAKVLRTQASQIASVRDGAKDLATEFGKIAESSSKMDKSTMWFSSFAEFTKDIPGLRTLSGPFEAAAKASRETVMSNAKAKDIQGRIGKLIESDSELSLKTGKKLTKAKLKEMNLEDITKGKSGKEAAKLLKNAQKTNKIQSVGINGLKSGFKALGPAIKRVFAPLAIITTIAAAIKGLVTMMFQASKETATFSQNLLVGREQAREIRAEVIQQVGAFNEINTALGRQEITRAGAIKQLDAINQKLGFQVNLMSGFGNEIKQSAMEAAYLTEQFGLSAEASSTLFLESVKTGKPLKEMTKEMFGQLGALSAQEGLTADINGLIERSTKISGNLRANFNGSSAALANALYQADRLGLSLEGMESVSGNLLDFQSSIENEMKAELLIGRNLNLEKAREAALMGDTETLMKEISKQAGTQKDFLKMNIVQRKALAGAVGLEVNELADMFEKQSKMDALAEKNLEIRNALLKDGKHILSDTFDVQNASLQEIQIAAQKAGKSEEFIRDMLGDQLFLRKSEESAQKKFNDALAQAKDLFASFVDGGLLDQLAAGLEGLINSSIFQGFAESSRTTQSIEDTESDIANKKLTEEQINLANENVRLAKESKIAQEQSGLVDDVTDVAGGALAGAAMGSIFGPIGMAIGGAIGGGIALFKNSSDQEDADIAAAASKEANKLYVDSFKSADSADDFIIRPGQRPLKFNKGDVVMGGTNLDGGGNIEAMLGRILTAIENGGNVYMDGNKVGKSLALSTSRMG
mgnify:FL=1